MAKVQTTIFQNPIEVDDAEVAVLRSQGLLVEDEPKSAAADKPAGAGAGDKPGSKENDE